MPAITDVLTAVGADLTAVVAAAAAIPAFRAVKEARNLREDQARPFVTVVLKPSDASRHFLYLVVHNYGNTVARNVRFTFDKRLQSTIDDYGYHIADVKFLSDGIATFAPGAEYRVLFDSIPDRVRRALPDSYTVTARYEDSRGKELPAEQYVLDSALTRSAPYNQEFNFHDLVTEVSKLREVIENLPPCAN